MYPVLWVKLSSTNQYGPPTKNMSTNSLGKWMVLDLGQGKYKLSLKKQDVLLYHKKSDQRILETRQKHIAGKGSPGQFVTIRESK